MIARVIGKASTQRVTCPECLSILEYEPEDVYDSNKGDGGKLLVMVVDCPACKHQVRLFVLKNGYLTLK